MWLLKIKIYNKLIMIKILINLYMFTWFYIIYFNLFIYPKKYYVLCDSNNKKYVMINIFSILNPNLIKMLNNKINKVNYLNNNKYIGLNNLQTKDILLAIPSNYSNNITSNNIISFFSKKKFRLYNINIKNDNKKYINDKVINFNNLDNLLLENIFNYKINKTIIPFYLILNK
jgi:hypothetical protein